MMASKFNNNMLKHSDNESKKIVISEQVEKIESELAKTIIDKKLLDLTIKFHADRGLLIYKLPFDVNEAEIKQMLQEFSIRSVTINKLEKEYRTAAVEISNVELLEEWDDKKPFIMRSKCVIVKPTSPRMLLCVARLPLSYTEEQFFTLIYPFGAVKEYFLMISKKTGKSKGYGFVSYISLEYAVFAKNKLHNFKIESCTLECDFVNNCFTTLKSLHSKCLYVHQLPTGINDLKDLTFTKNSIFCQRGLQNGRFQDWWLVEYKNWEEAEILETAFNELNRQGRHIQISYCMPGVHAIDYFMTSLKSQKLTEYVSESILPNPSYESLIEPIMKLFKGGYVNYTISMLDIVFSELTKTLGSIHSETSHQVSQNSSFSQVDGVSSSLPVSNFSTYPDFPPIPHQIHSYPHHIAVSSDQSTSRSVFSDNRSSESCTLTSQFSVSSYFLNQSLLPSLPVGTAASTLSFSAGSFSGQLSTSENLITHTNYVSISKPPMFYEKNLPLDAFPVQPNVLLPDSSVGLSNQTLPCPFPAPLNRSVCNDYVGDGPNSTPSGPYFKSSVSNIGRKRKYPLSN